MRSLKNLLRVLGSVAALKAAAGTEDFTGDPASRGWTAVGDASLFQWNSASGVLDVTWDSSRTNSFWIKDLGATITKKNDFAFSFDLSLADIQIGTTPGRPYTFEIAMGLVNRENATGPGFIRGSGYQSPNLAEWDYFPDSGFGATIATALVSSNNQFRTGLTFPFELETGGLYHVELRYSSTNQTLSTKMTRDGIPTDPIRDCTLDGVFSDFALNAISISSYSDEGQDPRYAGSILAHGSVDNLTWEIPAAPFQPLITRLSRDETGWRVEFTAQPGVAYSLERSVNLKTWSPVASSTFTNTAGILIDAAPLAGDAFYRIQQSVTP
jgi:hypothetical protein